MSEETPDQLAAREALSPRDRQLLPLDDAERQLLAKVLNTYRNLQPEMKRVYADMQDGAIVTLGKFYEEFEKSGRPYELLEHLRRQAGQEPQ